MMKAQGNLYRFQEKIEQQKIIYSQIAQVGHQFNASLNFNEVIRGVDRFIIDLLNFERFLLLMPQGNFWKVRAHGGYLDANDVDQIQGLKISIASAQEGFLKPIYGDVYRMMVSPKDYANPEASQFFLLDNFLVYSIGKSEGGIKALLVFGNTRAHASLHQNINLEDELDSLFLNFTALISGAMNTLHFMQAIQHESAQVKRLLNNMRQAVFSVNPEALVVEPVSRFADAIFGQNLVGKSMFETLFKDLSRGSEIFSKLKTAFLTVFGEDELQWELMEEDFPKKVSYIHPGLPEVSNERALKLSFRPIFDDHGALEKIMLVVEDVTELEKLEKEVSRERDEIQMIQELVKNSLDDLKSVFLRSSEIIQDCINDIERASGDPSYLGQLMRNLHTFKGNVRLFGFSFASQAVHNCESEVIKIKNLFYSQTIKKEDLRTHLLGEIFSVAGTFQIYAQVAQKVLQIKNQFEISILENLESQFDGLKKGSLIMSDGDLKVFARKLISVQVPDLTVMSERLLKFSKEGKLFAVGDPLFEGLNKVFKDYLDRSRQNVTQMLKTMEVSDINLSRLESSILKLNPNPDPRLVEQIKKDFRRLHENPIKPTLLKFQSMIDEVSGKLGKKVSYLVSGDEISMLPEKLQDLKDALVHMLRNSIDHGIESPEKRLAIGKKEVGLIEIQCLEKSDETLILLIDDGQGIDPHRISEIALKKGAITKEQLDRMTEQEKIDLIFLPSFSTKEEANELSGRGVGMDIVRAMLKKMNGELEILSRVGIGTELTIRIKNTF